MHVRLSLASLSLSYNLLFISMESLSDTQSSARGSRNAVHDGNSQSCDSNTTMSRRQWRKLYCPHCNEMVTKTMFYRHKRSFYNPRSKQWARSNITGMSDKSSSDEEAGSSTFLATPTESK